MSDQSRSKAKATQHLEEINKAFLSAKKDKFELGRQLNYDRNLVNHFSAVVLSNHPDKSANIKKSLLKAKPPKTRKCGNELLQIAQNLKFQDKRSESVLFFQLSADAFENEKSDVIAECCRGINGIACALIEENDEYNVKRHIVPIFRQLQFKIRRITDEKSGDGPKQWNRNETICINAAANIQIRLQEFQNAEDTCKEGLQLIHALFPVNFGKFHGYGLLLYQLARAVLGSASANNDRQRLTEAARYSSQALSALKGAHDGVANIGQTEAMIFEADRLFKMIREKIIDSYE